jgi:hypothetical protein
MELLSGHEKIITKSGISLNAETLNRGFTVCVCIYIACEQAVIDMIAPNPHLFRYFLWEYRY